MGCRTMEKEIMKCDDCKFLGGYVLGADECGSGNWLAFCKKAHWVDSDHKEWMEKNNFWNNCKDYIKKEKI